MFKKERLKHFSEVVYRELERYGYDITQPESFKFTINTDAQVKKYGVIDYYPKSDKVLIRSENKWIFPGLPWINNNLINNRGFYTRAEVEQLIRKYKQWIADGSWVGGNPDEIDFENWIKENL